MLFKPEHVEMILQGKKTATRRVWKRPCAKVGGLYKAKTMMLSKKYFARILVKNIYQQKLKDMRNKDAHAEGYPSIKAFKKIWIEINGSWNPNQEVTVIEFRVAPEEEIHYQIEEMLKRAAKQKFKCDTCGAILEGQEEVRSHKKQNWDHFTYSMYGSKLKLAFA